MFFIKIITGVVVAIIGWAGVYLYNKKDGKKDDVVEFEMTEMYGLRKRKRVNIKEKILKIHPDTPRPPSPLPLPLSTIPSLHPTLRKRFKSH